MKKSLAENVASGTRRIVEHELEIRALPQDPQVAKAHSDGSPATWWDAFKTNPANYIVQVGVESFTQMLPAYAAAPFAGPVGIGVGSLAVDFGSFFVGALQEKGVDVTNKAAVERALADKETVKYAMSQAFKHAGPVALLDTLSAGVAGVVLGPAKLAKRPVARELTNLALQAPVQGTLGGAGEALGQVAQGKEIDMADVMAEFVAEVFSTPGEVASLAGRRALVKLDAVISAAQDTKVLGELRQLRRLPNLSSAILKLLLPSCRRRPSLALTRCMLSAPICKR